MSRRFYAVQCGENYDCSYGSTVKRESMKMARALARDPWYDGEEIRICLCSTEDNYCDGVIIIREEGGVCPATEREERKHPTHFYCIAYTERSFGDGDGKVRDWGTATVYRFSSKQKRDEVCSESPYIVPISAKRARYMGWIDWEE